jgi:hypothetical protein
MNTTTTPKQQRETIGARIYQYISARGPYGAIDDECQVDLGLVGNGQSASRKGLAGKGLLVPSGYTRPTRSGRRAIVWVAVPPELAKPLPPKGAHCQFKEGDVMKREPTKPPPPNGVPAKATPEEVAAIGAMRLPPPPWPQQSPLQSFVPRMSTSREALMAIMPVALTLEERILRYIREHGPCTDEQLQLGLGIKCCSETSPRGNLVKKGLVRLFDEAGVNTSGRRAKRWVAVTA